MINYLELAKLAALRAGKVHKKYFCHNPSVKTKSSTFDLLTIADTEAEKTVVSLIKKYYPQHNFLAEEFRYRKTDSEYTWIIDPLDGTNNFASGLPIFCASVALKFKNEIIAGAVYDMTRNELFYAQKHQGSFLNGKRISVNSASELKESLLITGIYYDRGKKMEQTLDTIKNFLYQHVLDVRRLGAAALDLCYVACGRAAGFWEFELSPWDFAAGKLIVEEAGGMVTGSSEEAVPLTKKYFIVASNAKIHRKMLSIISKRS
jgi:myo-inositol-1(or 4)-monophosphatase